jgi:taurine dioxygenase
MPDIDIVPSGRPLGADVIGFDAAVPHDEGTMAMIRAAFSLHGVLCFRDQKLDEQQLIAFTQEFGEIESYVLSDYAMEQHPEVLIVSNILEGGEPIGLMDAGMTWHTDMSYIAEPPAATFLHAKEIPVDEDGRALGDTLFSNTAVAYDALSEDLKLRLAGARTTHSYEAKHARRAREGKSNRKPISQAQRDALPPVEHPVFRTHAESGRKCVYVIAGECEGITGVPEDESELLLETLAAQCVKPELRYRHKWRIGDLLMWDNCLVQHLAVHDYALPQRRLILRTTIKGDCPI